METNCTQRNLILYAEELDEDFDIEADKGREVEKRHCHLSGFVNFFMDECPGCGRTMPFEFDEGVCMLCHCDPCTGIVEEMTDEEFEELIKGNRYHIEVPELLRNPFETMPALIQRQLEFRKELALQEYQRHKSKSSEIF